MIFLNHTNLLAALRAQLLKSKLVVKYTSSLNFHQVVHLVRTRAWTLVQRKTEIREISKYQLLYPTEQPGWGLVKVAAL